MKDVDLTIVGGGPVGIFAAYYARLRDLDVRVIESLATLGGQISALYPQKQILDVAGFPKISGDSLVQQLVTQAKQLVPEFVLGTLVTDVQALGEAGFQIVTSAGTFKSGAVIIATGGGNFTPRTLPLPNMSAQLAQHLHYFVGDGQVFTNKRVLVAGGGDSAIDSALHLLKQAKAVHLMHRRATFRALEHSVKQLLASDVVLEVPFLIEDITVNADGSLAVTMHEVMGERTKVLEVDEVLVSYGFISENSTMQQWQVQPAQTVHGIKVDQTLQTDIPGLFAIGDAATYPGRTELLSTGFGEAPLAVNAAVRFLDPSKRGPIHSSSLHIENGQITK
ncbi:NAD(P)/FAD-dependent oxidoreductase [Periweissella fabalis]|uniref:Ferredoxin--NADP reductase n=1 Tax=Periweissella fabalis TaxID=1070421 RepID=A0A7X6S294_9LACO|nr:NAD(P)/FAD-dependent oxidoreductase [Periweissella fabalis]MCM0599519.1 NAD(P)/FAD-dependent oxidoreductase [Periweissella fabalis]NKZ23824.1 NAD(P)/FAD-dependent oxidoreductase [Periweissella fabalis]